MDLFKTNKPNWKNIRKILRILFWLFVFSLSALIVMVIYLSQDLPSQSEIINRQIPQSTKIYDRTGQVLLYELGGSQKRTVIPLSSTPIYLRDATISIEDERFYQEPAFDWRGIIRAVLVNVLKGRTVQGASTITQQLARNAFLSPEKTVIRKLKELVLAVRLSNSFSKDQILELYLNEVSYGPNFYGVESASLAYFGKSAKDLSLAEAALLAALPQAPSRYSPWGNHTDELFNRQKTILKKMLSLGKISDLQYNEALSEKINFQPQTQGIKAPHFSLFIQDLLTEKYGEEFVRQGGLKVITTLDWSMQQAAEKSVREGVLKNTSLYEGKNGSLVAENPTNGQILAMVGSKDYFDSANDGNFNVATQGLRQPGSALKPFIYLAALTKGYTPDTILFDVPTEFSSNDPNCPAEVDFSNTKQTGCFHPQNFDQTFRGPISLKAALAQSINIPAVKLLYLVGLKDSLALANSFGLNTLNNPSRYGLSLVLGGGEVRLIDLVGAYSVLAADCTKHQQVYFLEIQDGSGRVLEKSEDISNVVTEPKYCETINSILSDQNLRAGLFHSSLNLTIFPGRQVALKTGTTNDYRDAWVVGYTPDLAVGVWAGNNNNSAMKKNGSSILAALPIWNDFMKQIIDKEPVNKFPDPPTMVSDKPMLNGSFLVNGEIHSILQYVDRSNPDGPMPNNPEKDPQYKNWETGVLLWAKDNIPALLINSTSSTNTGNSSDSLQINISEPSSGYFLNGQELRVVSPIVAKSQISRITLRFNNQVIQNLNGDLGKSFIFQWVFMPTQIQDQNILEIEAETVDGTKALNNVILYGSKK